MTVDRTAVGRLVTVQWREGKFYPEVTGVVESYIGEPYITLEGDNAQYKAELARLATPDEEIAYWRERAEEGKDARG